jgi:hypothetical protein
MKNYRLIWKTALQRPWAQFWHPTAAVSQCWSIQFRARAADGWSDKASQIKIPVSAAVDAESSQRLLLHPRTERLCRGLTSTIVTRLRLKFRRYCPLPVIS